MCNLTFEELQQLGGCNNKITLYCHIYGSLSVAPLPQQWIVTCHEQHKYQTKHTHHSQKYNEIKNSTNNTRTPQRTTQQTTQHHNEHHNNTTNNTTNAKTTTNNVKTNHFNYPKNDTSRGNCIHNDNLDQYDIR